MDKITYVVTAKAGPKVAGRRVQPGDTLELTEFEARSELLAGSLALKAAAPAAAPEEAPAVAESPATESDRAPAKKR